MDYILIVLVSTYLISNTWLRYVQIVADALAYVVILFLCEVACVAPDLTHQ